MDFEEIKQILALVREHELAEFELEHQDFKIRIRKEGGATVLATPPPAPAVAAPAPTPVDAAPAPAPSSPLAAGEEEEVELAVVKAPIVGTFYHAPEPGAPPFVKVGDIVRKNQVLCIIEAMKLMNEIESEYEGEIVKIYVENGKPVQYGERLFAIR
ncbi:MAG TPA: acetyl-CoA carboxylase biotin carboxyl carrier protein, partial [Vicinamibacterales bacterium]